MAAAETDVLETRFDTLGLSEYESAFNRAAAAIGIAESALGNLDKKALATSVAFMSAGTTVVVELGKMGMEAARDEALFGRVGRSFKGGMPSEEAARFAEDLQDVTGVAHDQFGQMMALMGVYGLTSAQTRQMTKPLLDASIMLQDVGVSAQDLTRQVAQALESGQLGRLGRLLGMDDSARASFEAAGSQAERFGIILQALQVKGQNASDAFRSTLPGAVQAFHSAIGSAEEAVGTPFVGMLASIANAAAEGATALKNMDPTILEAVGVAAGVAGVGMIGYGVKVGWSVLQAARLSGENAKLQNETLKSEKRARGHAAALDAEGAAASEAAARLDGLAAAEKTAGGAAAAAPGAGLAGKAAAAGEAAAEVGMLKRAGRFVGSQTGMAVAMAGSVALDMVPKESRFHSAAEIASGALSGGATGAMLGSFVPVIGTGAGAVIGAVVGAASAHMRSRPEALDTSAEAPGSNPVLDELRKQNQTLREQLAELKGIRSGKLPFDTGDIPGALQAGALMYGREMA